MKILHTSDWHLGHMLYSFDRTEEHQAMLDQMVRIVQEEKPDVFLVCGDVYHTSQPSSFLQTMLTDNLVRIHTAHPQMHLILTAGNHDSSAKHEIFRTPWKALNVHTVGSLLRDHVQEHLIEIPQKGFVVAIPYVYERNLPQGFFQQALDEVQKRNVHGLPVVMTAHTTIRGCDFSGHDHATEYTAGGIDATDLAQMGEGYDYLALGHIHHEQFVHSGKHNVRYCGSPLPVSFDECYAHSVSLVEIPRHGEAPEVRKVGISSPRPLVTLPSSGFATWQEAKDMLRSFPGDIPAYIRLNVEVEDFLPQEASLEAHALCRGKECRFCLINSRRKSTRDQETGTLTVQEFQAQEPIQIAQRYARDSGIHFDDELTSLFRETLERLKQDGRSD